MFRPVFLLLIGVLLFSCNYPGKGSLGGWALITFPVQKDTFKLAVDSLRNANPENEIPEKWQYDSEYWKRNPGGITESEVLYIKKGQEEMYFFSYIPRENQNVISTTIALRSVYRNGTWYRKLDIDTMEQKKVSMRFYKEIIAKLELITKTRSRSEKEDYENPDDENSSHKPAFFSENVSEKSVYPKKELSLKEKSDGIALKLMNGKFDISAVLLLEKICAQPQDLTMQFFTTTVEELFYSHMASFINYYIANPGSCMEGKLKQSMEEYMSAYEPKNRMQKHIEKQGRIFKKAKRENLSPKQLAYLQTLFDSINLK
jgi:hypothetical protein